MLSAQLESSATSRVVLSHPSIDPFTNTRKASVLQFFSETFRMLLRFHLHRMYQGEDGIVYFKQNNSYTK